VRRTIVLADVGLDLDDPAFAAVRPGALTDESRAKQRSGCLEGRPGDERGDLVQRNVT
jgi:hypothetical protein